MEIDYYYYLLTSTWDVTREGEESARHIVVGVATPDLDTMEDRQQIMTCCRNYLGETIPGPTLVNGVLDFKWSVARLTDLKLIREGDGGYSDLPLLPWMVEALEETK